MLAACATNQLKDPNIQKAMDGVCLTGQGKGRLEHAEGRHLFSYESLFEPDKNQWSLALNLPVIGQELIRFDFSEANQGKMKTSGTFAVRLKNDLKSIESRRKLKTFFVSLGQLLTIFKEREKSNADHWNFRYQGSELIAKTKKKSVPFSFKAYAWDDYFERLSLTLGESRKGPSFSTPKMKLDLFVTDCTL